MMVSFHVVSEYSSTSPTKGGGEKIPGGPLYSLERIKEIAKDETGLVLWTRDCVKDVNKLFEGDKDRVADLVQRLSNADYIDSEWCENGRGAWAACDAYSLTVVEWIETARKTMPIEYFVKFAVNKLGTLVLTISCHT